MKIYYFILYSKWTHFISRTIWKKVVKLHIFHVQTAQLLSYIFYHCMRFIRELGFPLSFKVYPFEKLYCLIHQPIKKSILLLSGNPKSKRTHTIGFERNIFRKLFFLCSWRDFHNFRKSKNFLPPVRSEKSRNISILLWILRTESDSLT